jgi:hypothetical protein
VTGADELTAEAVRLISDASQHSIVLRALGSVGVKLHCDPVAIELANRGRRPKDIDLVTRKKDRSKIRRFFEAEGYETDRNMLVAMEGARYLFRNSASGIDIDVWVEVLDFCHRLDVSNRMGTGPSLAIDDLLLSKLQIVELTPNDKLDVAAILQTHEIGVASHDTEVIDSNYVAGILADDWGFWRTATGNIEALKADLPAGPVHRLGQLEQRIEATPKTLRWRVRSRLGERAQWWQDVDIPRDTY